MVSEIKKPIKYSRLLALFLALCCIFISGCASNKKKDIADIPGATVVDYPSLGEGIITDFYDPPSPQVLVESLKNASEPMGVAVVENAQTVFVSGSACDFYITTFDIRFTKALKNARDGETKKCVSLMRFDKQGKVFEPPHRLVGYDTVGPNIDGEFFYRLLPAQTGNRYLTQYSNEFPFGNIDLRCLRGLFCADPIPLR